MNGAIRIGVEEQHAWWFRPKKYGLVNSDGRCKHFSVSPSMMLVASFHNPLQLEEARRELSNAALVHDMVCLRKDASAKHSFLSKLGDRVSVFLKTRGTREESVRAGSQDLQRRIRQLLSRGGAVLLVRCSRVAQACDIIERAGGSIGL